MAIFPFGECFFTRGYCLKKRGKIITRAIFFSILITLLGLLPLWVPATPVIMDEDMGVDMGVDMYVDPLPHEKEDDPAGQRSGEYGYFNYDSMSSMLEYFNDTYPFLVDLTTSQDRYGLENCRDGYRVFMLRITNESLVEESTPEVLFLGGIHGDESISVSASMYLAQFLLANYHTDSWVRHLVDTREIYILPCLNPYGLETNSRTDGNGEDMNRDFSYDPSNEPYTTIGARTVHELMKEHLFISAVNWHSGMEAIGYAWGAYAHNTAEDECPDDASFLSQAMGMSDYAGDYSGYYPVGRNNQLIYPAYGAFSDYAYAATWDVENSDPHWPTEGCRSLGYTVEISTAKQPDPDTLGSDEEIYMPGGVGDGYIPKNIRLALYTIDTISPYVILNEDLPQTILTDPGENIDLELIVGGCSFVDSLRVVGRSSPLPSGNVEWTDGNCSIESSWSGKEEGGNPFTLNTLELPFTTPLIPGRYYCQVVGTVDQKLALQHSPDPALPPLSLYANSRLLDNRTYENAGNQLECRKNYTSLEFVIIVNSTVELYSPMDSCSPGSVINFTWQSNVEGDVLESSIIWGGSDPREDPEFSMEGKYAGNGFYYAEVELSVNWTLTYFRAVVTNTVGEKFYSDCLGVRTEPQAVIDDIPERALRGSVLNVSWHINGASQVDSTSLYVGFDIDVWNQSQVELGPFEGNGSLFKGAIALPDKVGLLYMGVEALVDSREDIFRSPVKELMVCDTLTIKTLTLEYSGDLVQTLMVSNLRVAYTENISREADPSELAGCAFEIVDKGGVTRNISGELKYDEASRTWNSATINVSSLDEDMYSVLFSLSYQGVYLTIPSPENGTFWVDHSVSISMALPVVHGGPTMQVSNITIATSCSSHPTLVMEDVLATSFEIFGITISEMNKNDLGTGEGGSQGGFFQKDILIVQNLSTLQWNSEPIDISGVLPGTHRGTITLNTTFEAEVVQIFDIVVATPIPPTITLSNITYLGGKVQMLEIGRSYIVHSPFFLSHRGAAFIQGISLEYGLWTVNLDEMGYNWEVLLQKNTTETGPRSLNLSNLPSGNYILGARISLQLVYPFHPPGRDSFVLDAHTRDNTSVNVVHIFWFNHTVDVVLGNGEMLDISNVGVSGSREGGSDEGITIEALIYRRGANSTPLLKGIMTRSRLDGKWYLKGWNVSFLSEGKYFVRFLGTEGNITFYGEPLLDNLTFFEISSETGLSSPNTTFLFVTMILFELARMGLVVGVICVFIYYYKRRKRLRH